jgi:hypothetical protein
MYSTQQKMLRETLELMLALIHVPRMHKNIYDSKRPYTTKNFGNENIFSLGIVKAEIRPPIHCPIRS